MIQIVKNVPIYGVFLSIKLFRSLFIHTKNRKIFSFIVHSFRRENVAERVFIIKANHKDVFIHKMHIKMANMDKQETPPCLIAL